MSVTERELRLIRIVTSCWQLGTIPRQVRHEPPPGLGRRMQPGRIHKAGSAEAILRHVLRGRGWTRAFRRGELSGEQHMEILEDVRQYGRSWLRHEAEQFARHYLGAGVDGGRSAATSDGDMEAGASNSGDVRLARELLWTPGPEGRRPVALRRALDSSLAANLGRFFRRAKQFVRELIVAATWGLTGPAPMTGEELQEAEREAVRQDAFFDRFYSEIEFWGRPAPKPEAPTATPPPMTPPQFVARVERYADSSWQAAQRINRDAAVRQGVFKIERRVLGHPKTEHCDDCPPLADLGWQPIGTLPRIGDTECGPLCLCHFEFAAVPDADAKVYAKGRQSSQTEIDYIKQLVANYVPTFNVKVVMGEK